MNRILKLSLSVTATLLASTVTADEVVRLSEPVSETATHEVFGAPMPKTTEVQTLGALVANSDEGSSAFTCADLTA